ncbi:hypothetical protein SEPCBS119000_004074 [Sporothrix epigloea]|uniref:Uncharacterized protein n=1 Tax=Sporothrix epigloea TaxID=1892477 RepID=A0ABP0DRE2_9PEZI
MAQISLPLSPLSSHSSLPTLPSLTELGLLGQQQKQLWKAWRTKTLPAPSSFDLSRCEKQQSAHRCSRPQPPKQDRPRLPRSPLASPSRDRSPARKRQALCNEAAEGRAAKEEDSGVDASPLHPAAASQVEELLETKSADHKSHPKTSCDDDEAADAPVSEEIRETEKGIDSSSSPQEKTSKWQLGQGHGLRALPPLPPLPPQRLSVQPQDVPHSPRLPILPWPAAPSKRKRDDSPAPAPSAVPLSTLVTAPNHHVYVLYKFDRVDQLGGQKRGQRGRPPAK